MIKLFPFRWNNEKGYIRSMDIAIILIVVLAAIALLVFLIRKNRRDKKELFTPEATDPVAEEKKEQQGDKDNL
jgi:uncharacterized protein YxeA